MDGDNKLCIICCLPFVLNAKPEFYQKIGEFCEDIINKVDSLEREGNNVFNCYKQLLKLDVCLGIFVCCACFSEITELLASKENMRLLEEHVVSLQMEILKGLRDLEECINKIKCHQENIKKTVEGSDELSLKMKLGTEMGSNCLALEIRERIVNGTPIKKGKLKGNLWILDCETEKAQEQTVVKVEMEETLANLDFDDSASNASWNASTEVDEKPVVASNLKYKTSKRRKLQNVHVRKTATMTLRTRSSTKPNEENSNAIPALAAKPKQNKKPKTKITLKPVLKTTKREHVPRKVQHCDLCSFGTHELPSFEQHMRHHENEGDDESKSLECPHCPFKFSTQQFFNFHQKCHEQYKLKCDVCSKTVPTLSLADHLKSHISSKNEDPPLKIIYCQNCYFCCTSRQKYLTHLHRHKSKTTEAKFTCDICSEMFSRPRGLIEHLTEKHEGALETIACEFPNCGKVFVSKKYLMAHRGVHSRQRQKLFPCPVCDKKFGMKCLLKNHSRVHTDEKPFGCNLCDKRFRYRDGMLGHQRRDHGVAAKLKCEICGKEFCAKRGLVFHMGEVHGDGNERFPCKICGKVLKRNYYLKGHMLRAHGEGRKWTCEQCGKGFKLETDLKGHMKVHGGVKNWKCEYCGKAFLRKENLTDHLRVHTGERPFVCEICGKDFNQASAMKIHKKNQHPN